MSRIRFFLLALLLSFCGLASLAQAEDIVPSRRYNTADGLPNNSITALAQTQNGLLWIGTRHGLVAYDGHEFRGIELPDSVRGMTVTALRATSDGSVWAGIEDDVVKVTPRGVTRSYLLDSHNVVEILKRGQRVLFVTQLAVWEQTPKGDSLRRTQFRYEELDDVTQVWGADLGPQGELWIANARKGPGRVGTDGVVDFADLTSFSREGLENQRFHDLKFTQDGTALVARGSRLYRFDPSTRAVRILTDSLRPAANIRGHENILYVTGTPNVIRYHAIHDRLLDPIGPTRSVPNPMTTTALRDDSGGLWVGTEAAGLAYFPAPEVRQVLSLDGNQIRHGFGFDERADALWGSTWGTGLYQFYPQRRHVTPGGHTAWQFVPSFDGRLHAFAQSHSARGSHWYRWTPGTGWEYVALARFAVRGFVDSSGVGYFWHNQGLYRHVPSGDTTKRTLLRRWPLEESQHHLMGPAPNQDIILFDQGIVVRLRRHNGTVIDTIASLPQYADVSGRRLRIDSAGRIWAHFSSLLRIDPRQGTAHSLLKGANIEAVEMAGDSLAMAKTNEGLYVIDAATGRVRRHLTKEEGLISNDVNGAALFEDTLYVGHNTGATLIPADLLSKPPETPQAVLTGLEVNLDERAEMTDSLMTADERAIGFSYTGASPAHADRVRYQVRLLPQDTTWSTTRRRFVRYTNLEPGAYRFEVRAQLGSGPPGTATSYAFTVLPHFYETWWFRALAGLGLLGIAVGAYRWRTRQIRRRERKLEAAVRDRTEKLAREKEKTEEQAERLAELDEAKNRFLARVSHELRTPLTLLLSPLRNALQRASDGAARISENRLRRMSQSANRLHRLVEQLLDLATLQTGHMELNLQPGDLGPFVQRCAEAFHPMAQQDGIELHIDDPSDRIVTRFDPDHVETIVSNLIGNGIKFTPPAGTVRVEVRRSRAVDRVHWPDGDRSPTGAARIEVSDTGPGIAPGEHEQIFARFERGEEANTRAHRGTGLGLALTRELVELHGGTIEVESSPGEGATFTVLLPLLSVDGSAPDEPLEDRLDDRVPPVLDGTPPGPGGDGQPAATVDGSQNASDQNVLVVEDNARMRAHLEEQLSQQWSVLTAPNGAVAWDLVRDYDPALVLSDVMMPELDGLELCRRIKSDEDLRTIPVVLLTARATDEFTVEGLESGADDFVSKPFDPAELRQRIENHLAAREHVRRRHEEQVLLEPLGQEVNEAEVPFVEKVAGVIASNLSSPDFTAGRLADDVALSRRQLTRRLKKTIGQTPAALIRTYRIERARELLGNNAKTVAEVAYAVGFRSPSHFSQVFQDEIGKTPTEYQDTDRV